MESVSKCRHKPIMPSYFAITNSGLSLLKKFDRGRVISSRSVIFFQDCFQRNNTTTTTNFTEVFHRKY